MNKFNKMGNKKTKLDREQIKQLIEETNFSEKEINEWHKSFLQDHPTGMCSIDEFKRLYTCLIPGDADNISKHVFRTFDSNHDENIDFR
jgi:Ca2+-binding EF-hand superfamily protein